MPLVDVFHVPHAQHHVRRLRLVLLHVQNDVAADHQPGDLLFCHIAGVVHAHRAAAAHDGQSVGDLHDLVEFVGDEDDRVALLLQIPQLLEQLDRLLCGQNGRRLVEDEDLRAADQRLEDLDLLLHADRDVHDLGLRLDVQVVFFRVFLRDGDGLRVVNEKTLARRHAEHHVFRHGQAWHEHEVLVHHADPVGDGDGRGGERQLFAVHPDLAARRLLQTKEHLHERRFAGAVFAHQRVDLASAEEEVHALVGRDTVGIHLGDPFHLDGILLVRTAGFFVWHTICSSLSSEKVVRIKSNK